MLLKTLALITGISGVLASSSKKFFRRDYIYNEDYSAFYKVHWADKSSAWVDAFITCDDEGAKLFYPEDLDEWTVADNLTKSLPDVDEIFVGVRDEFGLGDFLSVEGRMFPALSKDATNREAGESKCVVLSVRSGLYSVGSCKHRRPFICKKVDDETCPTVDSAYVYYKAAKKCYKVNKRPKIFSDAIHTCIMEGGILATPARNIIELLRNLIDTEQSYFIGARRIVSQGSFYNLQGSLYELTEGERNYQNNCKALRRRSDDTMFEINSNDCNTTLPFICEMCVKV